MVEDLIKRLKEAAQAATPQNLDTAQTVERYEDGSHITCPTCDGEGYAELNSDFCNYDGKAIGVQFYGIGPEHLVAEAYFRAASPAAILELIAMIEQQAARIAELEAAIRKQANAARSLADATIRDASIRQGLAEKAYAESSPEVLASERQANAMLTEENERLTARLTALESERDALLAAAGKEAVAVASDVWEAYLAEQKMVAGMPGLHARPSFIAGFHAAMSAVSTTQATAIYQTRGKLDPDSEWTDHRKKDFDILRDDLFDKRIVYTAPTAALEHGGGRDAWISVDERLPEEGQDVAFIVHAAAGSIQEHLNGRVLGGKFLTVGRYPTFTVPGLGFNASHWQPLPAPPAALSQKAGEQQ
jgi:hypothetical protein